MTQEMARRGYVCGPPLDIDRSSAYDVGSPRLLEWLFFLIEHDRVDLIHLSPPCTTFSAAAYPPVRDRAHPRGFGPQLFKTRNGTLMALRALAILLKCLLYCVMATLEQLRSSIMATLQEWTRLLQLLRAGDTICRLFLRLAVRQGRRRFAYLCDSYVAQSAIGKGRSGSGLRHVCRRSSCVALAAGLYPGSLFCPTRIMPADHPTKDADMPEPVLSLPPAFWTPDRGSGAGLQTGQD